MHYAFQELMIDPRTGRSQINDHGGGTTRDWLRACFHIAWCTPTPIIRSMNYGSPSCIVLPNSYHPWLCLQLLTQGEKVFL